MGIDSWIDLRITGIALSKMKRVTRLSHLCELLILDPAIVAADLQDNCPNRELSYNSKLDHTLAVQVTNYFVQSIALRLNAKATIYSNNRSLRKKPFTLKRIGLGGLKSTGVRSKVLAVIEQTNQSIGIKARLKQAG